MANNKVSSLFNIDLPDPKRSNFNLGRANRFSADVGYVIPCYVEEILPNSYKRLDIEALIQTNATIAPLMGSFKVRFDAFFVPTRLYYQHLDLNNIRPDFSDNFDYHYFLMPTTDNVVNFSNLHINTTSAQALQVLSPGPYNTCMQYIGDNDGNGTEGSFECAIYNGPSTLIDYLGYLPVGYNHASWSGVKRLNGNPFIGYFDIWRNFYSNPHDRMVPFRVQNLYAGTLNNDFNPPTKPSTQYIDRYVDITDFDDFVSSIRSGSYNSASASPIAQDVITVFNRCVSFIDSGTNELTGRHLNRVPFFSCQLCGKTSDNNSCFIYDTRDSLHFGLLPKTYNDDYFNSRFMNSFVSYMEESSRVRVDDNQFFTIAQLRQANRIAKYVDKSIFSDTRFGSWIKAHFGVKTSQKLNIPQFLGSISGNIIFNDIYATAQTGDGDITSNQALGSRSSLGQGYVKNKGSFIEFKATEPGYLMVMFSITPYVSYFQGIKKMYLKNSFNDMYKPEFDAIGYDNLQKLELFAVGETFNPYNSAANAYTPKELTVYNVSVGKHPAWLEYMTSFDESHGLFTQKYQYGAWVLNRPYSSATYDELAYDTPNNVTTSYFPSNFDATTYIRSEYFNSIFAVDKFTDNFQVQVRFYDRTKQPISKQILPHL